MRALCKLLSGLFALVSVPLRTLCKLLSGLFALVTTRSAARCSPAAPYAKDIRGECGGRRVIVVGDIHGGRAGPLQVGDRCLIDGSTPKVVIIDSVEHFGVPGCYGATYLTGPKPGSFTVALKKHLRFFYPESESGSHCQYALPGYEPSVRPRF